MGGTYDRQEELVNGRPAYVHREDPGSMLWHADGFWRIGRTAKLGTGACRAVEAKPHCLCPTESQVPEAVPAWRVYSSAAKQWLDAPGLRCIDDATRQSTMESASDLYHLVGVSCFNDNECVHGSFARLPEPMNGRVAYQHREHPEYVLCHAQGRWHVTVRAIAEQSAALGLTASLMTEPADHAHVSELPDNVAAWGSVADGEQKWVADPELRFIGREKLKATIIGWAKMLLGF